MHILLRTLELISYCHFLLWLISIFLSLLFISEFLPLCLIFSPSTGSRFLLHSLFSNTLPILSTFPWGICVFIYKPSYSLRRLFSLSPSIHVTHFTCVPSQVIPFTCPSPAPTSLIPCNYPLLFSPSLPLLLLLVYSPATPCPLLPLPTLQCLLCCCFSTYSDITRCSP